MTQDHVVDPADFLDRRRDLAHMASMLREGRNILLYGPRRVGKTSLIKRLAADLDEEVLFLRVDCQFASDPLDLARAILGSLRQAGVARLPRFLHGVRDAARGLRFGVEVRDDVLIPHVQLGTPPPVVLEDALQFVTRLAKSSRRQVILALDEFQEVMAWEGTTVSLLRAMVQENPRLQVLLSGSQPSILLGLTKHKNPFWKQLTEVRLAGLDVEDLARDYRDRYELHLDKDAVAFLQEHLGGHTMRLIQVLGITRRRLDGTTTVHLERAMDLAIQDNLSEYERILATVKTPSRKRLLLALAKERPSQPTGEEFRQRNRLGAGASVTKSLQKFRDLEVLDEENRFLDPLFERYLRLHTP